MVNNTNVSQPLRAYKEVKIGKTIYRVTNIYMGEINLQETLEKLTVRKVLDEILNREALIAGKTN